MALIFVQWEEIETRLPSLFYFQFMALAIRPARHLRRSFFLRMDVSKAASFARLEHVNEVIQNHKLLAFRTPLLPNAALAAAYHLSS